MLSSALLRKLWVGPQLDWVTMVKGKAPSYDQTIVETFCRDYAEQWVQFGAYEHTSKAQACDGNALADCHAWLVPLIKIAPTLEFTSVNVFKKQMLKKVMDKPDMNKTCLNSDLWAAERSDRVMTICYHMRRMKRNQYELAKGAASTRGDKLDFEEDAWHDGAWLLRRGWCL